MLPSIAPVVHPTTERPNPGPFDRDGLRLDRHAGAPASVEPAALVGYYRRCVRIVVVQHAEKRADGPDPGITDRGRRQALAVRALLDGSSTVTTSPMRRARETAAIVAGSAVPAVDTDLRERMEWRGPSYQPLTEFLTQWSQTTADRSFCPHQGESSLAVGLRMRNALISIANSQAGAPAVVVTHGGATVDLLRDLLSDHVLETRAPGLLQNGVPGAGITESDCDGDVLTVRSIAVIDHLSPADRTGHTR